MDSNIQHIYRDNYLLLNNKPSNLPMSKIGNKYFLLEQNNGTLQKCISVSNGRSYACKIMSNTGYPQNLIGYQKIGIHPYINQVEEVLVGETKTYIIFLPSYGDLCSYIEQNNLNEHTAKRFFWQVVSAVRACHEENIILRNIKLSAFVFKDQRKTQLKLETLDESLILDSDNDIIKEKNGCPAYVSPELLNDSHYSGKATDCWAMGVLLYALLTRRYPFDASDPNILFSKIRLGYYIVPTFISPKAKCLIQCLLRFNPQERLTAEEILDHPWFKIGSIPFYKPNICDQVVPDQKDINIIEENSVDSSDEDIEESSIDSSDEE